MKYIASIFLFLIALMTQAQNVNTNKLNDIRYLKQPGSDIIYLDKLDTINKMIIYESNFSKIFADKNDILPFIKRTLSSGYQDKCDSIIADTLFYRLEQETIHLFSEIESQSNLNQLANYKMPYILRDMIINNKVSILNKNNNTIASVIYYKRGEGGLCCCTHILTFDPERKNILIGFGCSDVIFLCE